MKPAYTPLLVCPLCHAKLLHVNNPREELWCRFDGIAFPIKNDMPIMLATYARQLSNQEKLAKTTKERIFASIEASKNEKRNTK